MRRRWRREGERKEEEEARRGPRESEVDKNQRVSSLPLPSFFVMKEEQLGVKCARPSKQIMRR